MARLGKRERAAQRKASGFDARQQVVLANLSSPVTRTNDRGLINTSSREVLGSKAPRFTDGRIKGQPGLTRRELETLADKMRHRYTIADQHGNTWGGCDREKVAHQMRDDLAKHPDMQHLVLSVKMRA